MSDESGAKGTYDFSTDPHGYTEKDIFGQDISLDFLLALHNGQYDDSPNSFNLTVAIDGVVISGIAISAKEWRRRMMEILSTGEESIAKGFEDLTSAMAERRNEILKRRDEEERPLPAIRFVHLRGAHVISGATSQKFPLWRGNLAKLSGWTLGSINTVDESQHG